MTKREKYLTAARRVASSPMGCCNALVRYELDENFQDIYYPGYSTIKKYNNGRYTANWFGGLHNEENQLARSLALLFMAELDK